MAIDNTSQEQPLIEFKTSGALVDIRLNRTGKHNAFSDEVTRALEPALRELDYESELLVAVVGGNGQAFSSGADVQQRQLRTREEFIRPGRPKWYGAKASEIFTRAVNWKLVVAAMHGYAIAIGLGVMLNRDLVLAKRGTT